MSPAPALFALLPNLGPTEMLVVMGIAVLLFGKRLPEVGRSLGKGIVEFKKGLNGITDELDLNGASTSLSRSRTYDDYARPSSSPSATSSHYDEASVPKFEPPAAASADETAPATGTQD